MKTAVLLYGYMRTYNITKNALFKNLIHPNNADLFIHTYDIEGVSNLSLSTDDIDEEKKRLGDLQDTQGQPVTLDSLNKVYGDAIKKAKIIHYDAQKFINDALNIPPLVVPVHRLYSLYNNITEVSKLLVEYVRETGTHYDAVVLFRPDLQLYTKIDINMLDLNSLNIPCVGGNLKILGKNSIYYVAGYKNVTKAEYIPHKNVPFSDQFIISSYENMEALSTLYSCLKDYADEDFPVCHSETTLYYHLGYRQNLNVSVCPIYYEILRNNYVDTDNSFLCKSICNPAGKVKQKKSIKYKTKLSEDIIIIFNSFYHAVKLPFHALKYLTYKLISK